MLQYAAVCPNVCSVTLQEILFFFILITRYCSTLNIAIRYLSMTHHSELCEGWTSLFAFDLTRAESSSLTVHFVLRMTYGIQLAVHVF
jgi:hypothetical protein